jgi:hypothetical protein
VKGLVSYFKCNEITTSKTYVDVDHGLIAKKIKEKVNSNQPKKFIGKITYKEKANNECKCDLQFF